MDIDFHYYITFIICRKAGFNEDDAFKIAYSSQYTDDNKYHFHVNQRGRKAYINEISQTVDITKPSEKRKTIYPLFHFIPGGEEVTDACCVVGRNKNCLVTVPNSKNAQDLFDAALKTNDPYRIGIAIHAFADTWSHQNFIGYRDKLNAQDGNPMPNIGHADFFHKPDKMRRKWVDCRLHSTSSKINNNERFLEAAKAIFIRCYKYHNLGQSDDQSVSRYKEVNLEDDLRTAMGATFLGFSSSRARRKAFKKICPELAEEKYSYEPNKWRYAAIEKKEIEIDIFDKYWAKKNFESSDWFKFQMAVEKHKEMALDKFKSLFEQVGFVF